jgi:hypothetical protein
MGRGSQTVNEQSPRGSFQASAGGTRAQRCRSVEPFPQSSICAAGG